MELFAVCPALACNPFNKARATQATLCQINHNDSAADEHCICICNCISIGIYTSNKGLADIEGYSAPKPLTIPQLKISATQKMQAYVLKSTFVSLCQWIYIYVSLYLQECL